jgi:hypothetical protein
MGGMIDISKNTFIIDSLDGAEHTRSKKNISSIICFFYISYIFRLDQFQRCNCQFIIKYPNMGASSRD